jgi:hypothetical protein
VCSSIALPHSPSASTGTSSAVLTPASDGQAERHCSPTEDHFLSDKICIQTLHNRSQSISLRADMQPLSFNPSWKTPSSRQGNHRLHWPDPLSRCLQTLFRISSLTLHNRSRPCLVTRNIPKSSAQSTDSGPQL